MKKVTCHFFCSICNKYYKSKRSLYNHNRRFHTKMTQIYTIPAQNDTKICATINEKTKNEHFSCEFCNRSYTRKSSLTRHQKTCKVKNNLIIENKELKKELKKTKIKFELHEKEIQELKDILNKQLKIHHKTFQKMKNSLNNNIVNSTINNNNNINIVELGNENLSNIISNQNQIKILNKKFMSLQTLVKLVHCSDKYKQFHNCIITNLHSNTASKFDEKSGKFITVDKNKLLNDIIEYRKMDIEEFYDNNMDELDNKTKNYLEKFFSSMEKNKEYYDKYKKDIKLMLYNEKESLIN